MIISRDAHVQSEVVPITINGVVIGTLYVDYEVQEYIDTRSLSSRRACYITCRQRFMIPSPLAGFSPGPTLNYLNYPIALVTSISPQTSGGAPSVHLKDYFPRTLNASVSATQSTSSSAGASQSSQYTSGSSVSQTNSFDVSASIGFFGDLLTGGLSGGYQHSTTGTAESSASTGHESSLSRELLNSDSMSIKDWSSCASFDANAQIPTWTWGQTFPWNVLALNNLDKLGNVVLPDSVRQLLSNDGQIFPPSQLSQFGVNFISMARWHLTPAADGSFPETLTFAHDLNYFTGSHSIQSGSLVVNINNPGKFHSVSKALNLALLGLDPITTEGESNGAITGFAQGEFMAAPGPGQTFRIKSGSNNLYITGQGFNSQGSSDSVLMTNFPSGTPVKVTVQFKVANQDIELALLLRHWATAAGRCVVSVVINGNANNPIVRHVDSLEAGSGSNNVTSIILREKPFSSPEYFDYLQLGLNTLELTITPSQDNPPQTACGYALRALAII